MFYLQLSNQDHDLLGSDGSYIFPDITTLKGALNRFNVIRENNLIIRQKRGQSVTFYSYYNIYDSRTYKKEAVLTLDNYQLPLS